MASVTFQPFIDKENAAVPNSQPGKARQLGTKGLGGKVFNSGAGSLTTPRRALGDLKNTIATGSSTKPSGLKPQRQPELKPCNPFSNILQPKPVLQQGKSKLLNDVTKKSLELNKKKVTESQSIVKTNAPRVKAKEIYDDEIEQMFIYKEPEDDFEDVMPKSQRINSYILDKLISWRLPCMTGPLSDSEDEEAEEVRRKEERWREEEDMMRRMKEVYDKYKGEETKDQNSCDTLELEPLEEIDIEMPNISLLEINS